jgi:hypothetical protein
MMKGKRDDNSESGDNREFPLITPTDSGAIACVSSAGGRLPLTNKRNSSTDVHPQPAFLGVLCWGIGELA